MEPQWREEDFLSCSGSRRFAKEMVVAAPFSNLDHAIRSARDIWFNKVDVKGWLEAFAAHPEIGSSSKSVSLWSKEEQSAALASATDSTMQDLLEWNTRYREKFGFVFLICASGRGTPEILAELKKRYVNRPIVELEIAAQEEMKIIELRLARLFKSESREYQPTSQLPTAHSNKPEARMGVIAAHFKADTKASADKSSTSSPRITTTQSRPPITSHVLDIAQGHPASGIEVKLEIWKHTTKAPSFADKDIAGWEILGSSVTNSDGRCGPLLGLADLQPGHYRISFDTGNYNLNGFFPYVSIVFVVKESQKMEHFHVPLLLSPFGFSTYRGS